MDGEIKGIRGAQYRAGIRKRRAEIAELQKIVRHLEAGLLADAPYQVRDKLIVSTTDNDGITVHTRGTVFDLRLTDDLEYSYSVALIPAGAKYDLSVDDLKELQ